MPRATGYDCASAARQLLLLLLLTADGCKAGPARGQLPGALAPEGGDAGLIVHQGQACRPAGGQAAT